MTWKKNGLRMALTGIFAGMANTEILETRWSALKNDDLRKSVGYRNVVPWEAIFSRAVSSQPFSLELQGGGESFRQVKRSWAAANSFCLSQMNAAASACDLITETHGE
jgi:hypothetical protein